MTTINNFRLLSIRAEEPPQLEELDIIENYQIYQSQFNLDLYVIFDHDFNMYRCLEYMGINKFELDKNLSLYITKYYIELSDEEKSTPTIYLPK
jgi:hypothetical protein